MWCAMIDGACGRAAAALKAAEEAAKHAEDTEMTDADHPPGQQEAEAEDEQQQQQPSGGTGVD